MSANLDLVRSLYADWERGPASADVPSTSHLAQSEARRKGRSWLYFDE